MLGKLMTITTLTYHGTSAQATRGRGHYTRQGCHLQPMDTLPSGGDRGMGRERKERGGGAKQLTHTDKCGPAASRYLCRDSHIFPTWASYSVSQQASPLVRQGDA
ncbi:hypothetical protein GQ53DRAFT_352512 [Thozetella sp. PMI_491]|nr:hypothetical protein GQ53DRAFT_352512 [Thozetella sp. PMI_491]